MQGMETIRAIRDTSRNKLLHKDKNVRKGKAELLGVPSCRLWLIFSLGARVCRMLRSLAIIKGVSERE